MVMDCGKEMLFEERRKLRSKEVKIQFVTPDCFNVVDEEGNLKYVGKISPLECTCPSFFHSNNNRYETTHAEPLRCKHIMAAERIRGIK